MAYISEKYQPEDKTTERERKQAKFQATLLGLKRGPVEKTSYRRRANDIAEAGQAATTYEVSRRNKREAAAMEAARKKAEQETIRKITLSIGQGRGPSLIPRTSKTSTDQTQNYTPTRNTGGLFDRFMAEIGKHESSNNYSARNRDSGAMGKYQIMPGNIRGAKRGWDYEALGRDVSTQEFMRSPQIQEAIARYKMQQYFNKYGPRGAAISWYAGPGALKYSSGSLNRKQGAYSSINTYANAIIRRLGL